MKLTTKTIRPPNKQDQFMALKGWVTVDPKTFRIKATTRRPRAGSYGDIANAVFKLCSTENIVEASELLEVFAYQQQLSKGKKNGKRK